jgi:hypothetical protein
MRNGAVIVVGLVLLGSWLALGGDDRPLLPLPPPDEPVAATLADGTPVWVMRRAEGDVTVVEALSPRYDLGVRELVGWCPGSRQFFDTLHASRWAEDGSWASGPATRGLATYEAEVRGGGVAVGDTRVEPEDRDGVDARGGDGRQCGSRDGADAGVFHEGAWARPSDESLDAAASAGDVILRGTLFAAPGRPLLFCADEGWSGAADACPSGAVETDAEHDLVGRGLRLDATFLADRRDGRLEDVRLLPSTRGFLSPTPPAES